MLYFNNTHVIITRLCFTNYISLQLVLFLHFFILCQMSCLYVYNSIKLYFKLYFIINVIYDVLLYLLQYHRHDQTHLYSTLTNKNKKINILIYVYGMCMEWDFLFYFCWGLSRILCLYSLPPLLLLNLNLPSHHMVKSLYSASSAMSIIYQKPHKALNPLFLSSTLPSTIFLQQSKHLSQVFFLRSVYHRNLQKAHSPFSP